MVSMSKRARFDFETKVFAEKSLVVLRRGKAILYKFNRRTREYERVGPLVSPHGFFRWLREGDAMSYECYLRLDKEEKEECLVYMALWTLWYDKRS